MRFEIFKNFLRFICKNRPTIRLKTAVAVFLLIASIGGYLRFSRLGAMDFHHDEFFYVSTLKGYQETGKLMLWDWMNEKPMRSYEKGSSYAFSLLPMAKIFGINEWSMRFPSAVFGTIGIFAIFLLACYFSKNLSVALLSSAFFAFNDISIYLSRFVRDYSLYALSIMAFLFFVHKAIDQFQKIEFHGKPMPNIISLFKNKNLVVFSALALLLFFISHSLQQTVLSLVPGIAAFLVYMYIKLGKQKKYFHKRILEFLLILSVFVLVLDYFGIIRIFGIKNIASEHIGLDWKADWTYVEVLAKQFRHETLAIVFFIGGLVVSFKKSFERNLFLALIFIGVLLQSALIWERFTDFRYIYFVLPCAIYFIAWFVFTLADSIAAISALASQKLFKTSFAVLAVLLFVFMQVLAFPGVNHKPITQKAQADWEKDEGKRIDKRAVAPHYKATLAYVKDNAAPDDLIIIHSHSGNALFYLKELPNKTLYLWKDKLSVSLYIDDRGENTQTENFFDVISKHEKTWIIIDYQHLLHAEIQEFLFDEKFSQNNKIPGSYKFKYSGSNKIKPFAYWPAVYLIAK